MSRPVVYWGSERDEDAPPLAELLRNINALNNIVALDTETSGLFVDGDYKDGPPARVSVVSLAWEESRHNLWCQVESVGSCNCDQTHIVSLAIPLDQGRISGKPGRWSDELDTYEKLPHTEACNHAQYYKADAYNWHVKRCYCAPWNYGVEDWFALCEWLADKRVVMHNGKYDLHMMNAGLRTVPNSGIDLSSNFVWDTMLAQGIVEPLESSALKPTAERLWGQEWASESQRMADAAVMHSQAVMAMSAGIRDEEAAVKAALRKNGVGLTWRYDLLDWGVIGPYAGKDAELTLRLFKHHQALIAEGALSEVDQDIIAQELALSKLLFKMELRGVGLDADAMRVEADKMRVEIERLKGQLPFDPPNITGAKRWFFGYKSEDNLEIIPIKTTPKGAPCLDAEVIARLAADNVPGAKEWLHICNMQSALSKWYTAWPYKTGPDGRIRTNFRQGRIESDRKGMTSGGAISGRLSAERVQLQGVPKEYQLPKAIRGIKPKKDGTPGLIVAKPGYQLWEIDASNAEVRVAAWLSQCKNLADVINSGVNIHDGNTRNLFALEPGHPDWEMYRTVAKTTIFGDLYGAGVRTLKAQIEAATKIAFPESRVKDFKAALKAAYPELSRTAKRCQAKADKSMGGCGYVRLVNGRKRVFGWAERTHKAFNACIQGGVAETMKTFMLQVEDKFPGVLINQVHDSVWVELSDQQVDSGIVAEIQAIGAKLFTETFSTPDLTVQFEFDAKRLA